MAISGTAAIFSRLTNLRNVVKSIGSSTTVVPSFNGNLCLATRSYSVDINSVIDTGDTDVKPKKKISKAMLAYLQRAQEYDEFMKKEVTEYQIGKRHLANMMGENPETFDQKDINKSIRYLFPSGLYERKARPIMEAPERIFAEKKAAQFDESGRPHHFLFYTCVPNYHQALYDIVETLHKLNAIEDQQLKKGIVPRPDEKLDLLGTQWIRNHELEQKLLEPVHEIDYGKFIAAMDRLVDHPYSFRVKDFIMQYRIQMQQQSKAIKIPKPQYTLSGRPYIRVQQCKRKTAIADVTVVGNGTGKITINGKDIRYFLDIQSREQIIFPLIFTGLDSQVDVEATVEGGGFTGQSGAIRLGISKALRSFVDEDMVEKMRMAGLLTMDRRMRERKKPGQEGARRKFTWKKR